MNTLSFVLECAAIASLTGTAASLILLAASACLRPLWRRQSSSARADWAFVIAIVPAIAVIAAVASAAAPSIASVLGLAADHCPGHSHHLHVCLVHSTGLRPVVATLGAFALVVWTFRAGSLLRNTIQVNRCVRALERLGTRRAASSVIEIPGAPRLCHAIGLLRGRILISESLIHQLRPAEIGCALAHERAHLQRRDPLSNLLMSVAALFQPPFLPTLWQRAYRAAAEEACDDAAAIAVGDGTLVAEALVAVATVQGGQALGQAVPAFGEHGLESRVRRLLHGEHPRRLRRAYALVMGTVGGVAIAVATGYQATFLHDTVETLLDRLF